MFAGWDESHAGAGNYEGIPIQKMEDEQLQGSRKKSGKDTEEEDGHITEKEPGGADDKTSINTDTPIISGITKANDKLQIGNITMPMVKFPGEQIVYPDDSTKINKNSPTHFKYIPSCAQNPYRSNPFSFPSSHLMQYQGFENVFNVGQSYEQQRRMSSSYNVGAYSSDLSTDGPYVPQISVNKSNIFMQSYMKEKLLHFSNDTPHTSNKPMQHSFPHGISVIRSSKIKQASELQYKADMLKHEGSILRRTGMGK